MRILIATVFEYPHVGGLSTHVQTLSNGLNELGHEVNVVSFSDISPLKRKCLAQGPSFLLNKWKKGRGFVWSHNIRRRLLAQLLREYKGQYDIVNSQDVYTTLAATDVGFKTVATVHGYMAFEAISKGSIIKNSVEDERIRAVEKKAYQVSNANITVDTRIKEYIKDVSGVDSTAIKNFIDVTQFNPSKVDQAKVRAEKGIGADRKVIFVPRRLTEKNGVIYPLLAMKKILESHRDALLLYAGTGEEFNTLKNYVREHQLEGNVSLLGAVPHEKMIEYYALANVVVVPSIHSHGVEEATSISALEAMGSGSPLIATAIGGLKEIINDQEDGLLIPEKDTEALARAVVQLFEDQNLGSQLATAARKKIETDYSHIAAASKYEEVFNAVTSGSAT